MTRSPQLEQLLNELPDERLAELLDFLQRLTNQSKTQEKSEPASIPTRAQHSFGLIPADPALVRHLLAEDLYGVG